MSAYRLIAAHLMLSFALLSGCASGSPAPDWQNIASGAMRRYLAAYLAGNTRVAGLEFAQAEQAIARTGRPDLLARVALNRCAAQIASLVIEPCSGFSAFSADAAPAELAYANYLRGQSLERTEIALLPAQHRPIASHLNQAASAAPIDPAALSEISDPLARLIGISLLFQANRASPAVIEVAAATASAQGWSRPLLAWLYIQKNRAQSAAQSQALARRIAVLEGLKPVGAPAAIDPAQ